MRTVRRKRSFRPSTASAAGILGPPALHKDDGERVADAQGTDDDEGPEKLSAEPRGRAAPELVDLAPGNRRRSMGAWRRILPVGGLVVDGQGIPQ